MARLQPPLIALILAAAALVGAMRDGAVAAVKERTGAVEAPVIDAADALDHVGEECVVEMVVRAARALVDKDICFLNSRQDRRAADTFTAVIFKGGLARFREAGIENPALHFLDRRIRVRGVVGEHRERAQIVIEDPAQIEIVADPERSPESD